MKNATEEKLVTGQQSIVEATRLSEGMAEKKVSIEAMMDFEDVISQIDGAKFGDDAAPLEHFFADSMYARKITMQKEWIFTSKIHKTTHLYFVMTGHVSVLSSDGGVLAVIKAPHFGITRAGTKRILHTHEETIWVTVHATQSTDLKEIEQEIIAEDFEDFLEHTRRKEALSWHGLT